MQNMKKIACLMLLLESFAQPVWPADDLMSSQLVDQARYWQQRDRDDIAADLWRKLLRTDPKHPEALVRLGVIEARSGNTKKAEALYNRASKLATPPAGLNELSAALKAVEGTPKNLPPAPPVEPKQERPKQEQPKQEQPKQEQPKQERPKQEQPKQEQPKQVAPKPVGQVVKANRNKQLETKSASQSTLDLYQVPGATSEKWAEARRDLEELARNHPGDASYLIVLARHLTYREATRREAIRQIAGLVNRGSGAEELQKTWRQALIWLNVRTSDLALFSAYLTRFPNDSAIGERLRTLERQGVAKADGKEGESRRAARADKNIDSSELLKTGGNQARAAAILKLALVDEQALSYDAAAAKLEDAMLLDPTNPWVRLALARQYQHLGVLDGADSLIDNLLEINPDMPEALYARAMLYAAQQMWWEGLGALERIPPSARIADMAKEQRRMWVNVQVQRARQFFGQGNIQQANALMGQAQAGAGRDDSLSALVAGGWLDLGQPVKGLRLMREIVSSSPMKNVVTRIKYAEMLLNTYQDAELSATLRDLSVPGRLNMAQQEDVNHIILGYTLRLTETLRESGRIAEATELISPALQRSDDPRLQLAMARIYKSSGDPARALPLVEKTIVREPDDLGHRLLASELALAVNALGKADGHAKAALELAPNHPRALAAAGRVEKKRGNVAKAIAYFQRAQALERDKDAFAGVPGNLALRLVDDELNAPPSVIKPSVPGSSLLPIPEVRPKSERAPAAAYPDPEVEAPRPATQEIFPSHRIEQPGKLSGISTNGKMLAPVDLFFASIRQTSTRIEDLSMRTEIDNFKLKLSTSIDLAHFARRSGKLS